MKKTSFLTLIFLFPFFAFSAVFKVGKNEKFKTIKQAIAAAKSGDTVVVQKGIYREGTINLEKPIVLLGVDRPVLDGNFKGEIITFRADNIVLKGFKLINSGRDEIQSIAAVHVYTSSN